MSSHFDIKQFFRELKPCQRLKFRERYEDLLKVECGEKKGYKMPWMVPAWTSGLKTLNEVIEELKTQNDEN